MHGQPRFEHLAGDRDATDRFNAAMAAQVKVDGAALSNVCDLSSVATLVDVGGGHGALMAAVLIAHQSMRGVVFDLSSGLDGAADHLEMAGVALRCQLVAGSFF